MCFYFDHVLYRGPFKLFCYEPLLNSYHILFSTPTKKAGTNNCLEHWNETSRSFRKLWQTGQQTNRPTDKPTNRPTDRPTDRPSMVCWSAGPKDRPCYKEVSLQKSKKKYGKAWAASCSSNDFINFLTPKNKCFFSTLVL